MPKRVYRLYRELGLQLRNKTPKRRVKAKLREDRMPATRANETWAMDFVHDQLATGRSCACSRSSIPSRGSRRRSSRGSPSAALMLSSAGTRSRRVRIPAAIRVDQGTEFVSARSGSLGLSARCHARLLPPRQADRQCVHRIFNGKFRAECLNAHTIGNKTPIALVQRSAAVGPP